MGKDKGYLVKQVIMGARENNTQAVLFHQAIGDVLGINVTDMKCVDIIMLKGQARPTELSALTGLSSGSTTAMIDRLERKGLIERHPDHEDRRGTVVMLAKPAIKQLSSLFDSMSTAMQTLVSKYSERELEILSDYFRRSVALWKRERQKVQT